MSVIGDNNLGTGVPMFPGCTKIELVYNCLIPIPRNSKVEDSQLNEDSPKRLENEVTVIPKCKGPECYQPLQNDKPHENLRSNPTQVEGESLDSKSIATNHYIESSIGFGAKTLFVPLQGMPARVDGISKRNGLLVEENKAVSTVERNDPESEVAFSRRAHIHRYSKWYIPYDTKVRPFLPPFWQGELPKEHDPTFVYIQRIITEIARLKKKIKSDCEFEMSFFDHMLHFHLMYKGDEKGFKLRNEFEVRIYMRVMSLYYFLMGLLSQFEGESTNYLNENGNAEKLIALGKISNRALRFLLQLLRRWEQLPVGNIRDIVQTNQTLDTMLQEIDKEFGEVVRSVDEVNNTSGIECDIADNLITSNTINEDGGRPVPNH